jgi:hypothetical protein
MGRRVVSAAVIAPSMGVLMAFQSLPGFQWPEASAGTRADDDLPASPLP